MKGRRHKGRAHGAAMMAWLFFANMFDPKKAAAIEHIQDARRLGNPANRATAAAPPSDGSDK